MPSDNVNPDARHFPALRLITTLVLLALASWVTFGWSVSSTLASGKLAGMQFDPSDENYLIQEGGQHAIRWVSCAIDTTILLVLIAIWWGPVARTLAAAGALCVLTALAPVGRADAYYQDQDWAETFFILPNESAFFIPDVGDNKSSQSSFGSEQYLEENKIPAKRFNIPHTRLPNSGYWSNKYVPAGRLIVVDRTPFSREWVPETDRGTGAKDEGFHCQSSEGLDITVGISIGTSVHEEDAAKFLYHFGVKPPVGDRTQPEIIFTSVFYGRSLVEVMDGPVRNKIQSLVCGQLSTHSLDDDNSQASAIMSAIEKDSRNYLGGVGITLDYIGWADTFTFDPSVQSAINRVYVSEKDKAVAQAMAPYVQTIQGLALATALRDKFDGKLPTSLSITFLPQGIQEAMSALFKGSPAAPAK